MVPALFNFNDQTVPHPYNFYNILSMVFFVPNSDIDLYGGVFWAVITSKIMSSGRHYGPSGA
jgi:hypothetical protein